MLQIITKFRADLFIYWVASIAAIGGFLFGFDTGIISGALIFIEKTFFVSTIDKELIVASVVLGAFVSCFYSGKLVDHLGRRKMLIIAAIIFLLGTFIVTFTQDVPCLVIGRFILGLAIGISSYTVPLFISEMAPTHVRGQLVLLNAIMITAGEAIAFIVDYALVGTHSWRLMFATGFIPAAALLIGMWFMPATPRWLALKGFQHKAKDVLQKIRNKQDVELELAEINKSAHHSSGNWRDLLSPRVRKVLIIGLGLGILQQFVGINTVMYYGPYIFKTAGFVGPSSQILATFLMGVVNTIVSVIAFLIVDKFGRRSLLIWGMIVAAISLAALGALFYLHSDVSHFLTIIFMITYVGGYAISLGAIFWLIIAEIYPLNIRGIAMGFVAAIQWLANFIVASTFLTILNNVGPSATFWLYSLMCIIAVVFISRYVPETKNMSLEEIEQQLAEQSIVAKELLLTDPVVN